MCQQGAHRLQFCKADLILHLGDLTSQRWFQITCGSDAQVSFSCGSCKNIMISTIGLLMVPLLCVLHDCQVKIRGYLAWGLYTFGQKLKLLGIKFATVQQYTVFGNMLSLNQRVSSHALDKNLIYGTDLKGENDLNSL